MTSGPRLMAVADARDDASAELANLRAAYAAACAELVDVRRQRDESIAHGQELLSRLVEADEKLAAAAAPTELPPVQTPVAPTPAPISPVPTIVGSVSGPVAPVLVASVDDVDADDEADEDEAAVVEDAVVLPLAAVVPAQPVRWLPPEEDGTTSSMAHEFAALKELDSDPADEAAATTEPLASPMNVLPDAPVDAKGSRWRLRTR